MIETNVPHSGGDDAQVASSGGNEPPSETDLSEQDLPDSPDSDTDPLDPDTPDSDSQYLPPFSRKRLTRRQWQLAFTLMGTSILICIVVVATNLISVPYVSFSPGAVYSLSEAVSLDDGEGEFAIYPPESDMGFVTVRRSRQLNLWRLFFDSLDDRIDIRREQNVNRGLSLQELDRIRAADMLTSQGNAVEVAFRHLNYTRVILVPNFREDSAIETIQCYLGQSDDPEVMASRNSFEDEAVLTLPDGSQVTTTIEGLRLLADSSNRQMRENLQAFWQSTTKLLFGDILTSANGQPVQTTSDLFAALEGVQPGDTFNLEVQFFDQPAREISLKLNESNSDEGVLVLDEVVTETSQTCPDSQSWLVANWPDLELITKVSFDTGDVGGPSAGLAFALAVVDLLTEGDLTGGYRVATTGIFRTPFSDEVSSVGGVRQKTTAVRNSGYDIFLVPENDYDEAIAAAGDKLRVERVSTLRDALAILECLGGDPVISDSAISSSTISSGEQPAIADSSVC